MADKSYFIDVRTMVDDDGQYNSDVLDFIRQRADDGDEVVLWSAAGRRYAEQHAERAGIKGMVTACLSKPGHYVTAK